MNIYRHQFKAQCPNNGARITYELELTTARVVPVEQITQVCSELAPAYHEEIADFLIDRFGGGQVIRAHHHGVDIETRRGVA